MHVSESEIIILNDKILDKNIDLIYIFNYKKISVITTE